jgi:LmbE family N-acetylglucosaminyl deacetylase
MQTAGSGNTMAPVGPMPEDWKRAVAVVAHPDDLEYGTASAVARWTRQGKEIAYVMVTSGEAGIDGMAPEVAGPLRQEEERRSAAVVGVDRVEFLGHADGMVEAGLSLRRDLARALRRLRPDIVITMSFDLAWGEDGVVNHADHRATGLTVLDACRDAANRWVFPGEGEPWTGARYVYVAGAANPTHFVDVSATLGTGVTSLREHRAYIEGLGREFDADEFLRNMAAFTGMTVGCEYAVAFQRYTLG